jgi:serine/threonine protein kinase
MGTVFEAVHDRIGRRVALKVLNARLRSHPQALPRLLNEARAVNLIEHPGLVEVYDCFETQDGGAAIVMELLRGESLHERMERGPMPAETARIGRQIAEALAAAHERGIVHRDLKPENVMILPDPATPAQERIKILDFGLAKIDAGLAEPAWQVQTRATTLLGTPRYMAPEQCKGAGPVDDRADVYALGVILYQMMVGHPPFDAAGVGELLAMHIYAPPPPLAAPLRQGAPILSALIEQMLQKDPAHRPSMAEVAVTLAQAMQADRTVVQQQADRTVVQPMPPQPEPPPAQVHSAPAPRPALSGPSLTLWCEPEEGPAPPQEAAAPETEFAAPPRPRRQLVAAVAAGLAVAVAVAWAAGWMGGRRIRPRPTAQIRGVPAAAPAAPAVPSRAPPPPVAFPLPSARAMPPATPTPSPTKQDTPRATKRRKAAPRPPTETRIIESNADVEVLP